MYYTANMSGGGDAAEVDIISEAPLSESQIADLPDGERERVVIEWSLWYTRPEDDDLRSGGAKC